MSEAYVVGLFTIAGVLVGALSQYWFAGRTYRAARNLVLKSNAYADYVNAVAHLAFASKDDQPSALAKVVEAKARICVFGDKSIIDAMVRLEETRRDLSSPESRARFADLLQKMRREGIAVGEIQESDIHTLLFVQDK